MKHLSKVVYLDKLFGAQKWWDNSIRFWITVLLVGKPLLVLLRQKSAGYLEPIVELKSENHAILD